MFHLLFDACRRLLKIYQGRLQQAARFERLSPDTAAFESAHGIRTPLDCRGLQRGGSEKRLQTSALWRSIARNGEDRALESGESPVAVGGFQPIRRGVKEQTTLS